MRQKRIWPMFALFIAVLLGGNSGAVVHAASKVENIQISRVTMNFVINGELYRTPEKQQGFIYKSRTYVPLRFAAYTFEQAVGWNANSWTASVSRPTAKELKEIGEYNSLNRVPAADAKQTPEVNRVTIKANKQEVSFVFFGKKMEAPKDLPTILYQGTLYVPLRFFAETIGIELEYDDKTRTVSADTNGKEGEAGTGTGAGNAGSGSGNAGGLPTGPSTPKESYDSIIKSTESSIAKLEASCTNRLTSAYLDYKRAKTDEEREKAKANGSSIVADCDSSFYDLMDSLTKRLTDIGYDPVAVVNDYSEAYEQRKKDAQDNL